MTPYIILFVYVFTTFFLSKVITEVPKKQNTIFLILTFIYIYIFCSLRSFTVGCDIAGYIQMYERTAHIAWNNWDYVYFEKGYILLMKLCIALGLSARGFFFIVYAIILYPIYLLIKRYSAMPIVSVITYLSFQFFVFDLTGLRQAIGISLCIGAYIIAQQKNRANFLKFTGLVFLASTFHQSALIFLPVYYILRLPINKKILSLYTGGLILCILLNKIGVANILSYFEKSSYEYSTDDSQQIGLTLVFISTLSALGVWTNYTLSKQYLSRKIAGNKALETLNTLIILNKSATSLLLVSNGAMLLFNGSVLLRASMYYYIFIVISTPFFFSTLKKEYRPIIAGVFMVILISHFFTREIYTFDIQPYTLALLD